ncbi:MAG: response regulator [Marinilabiliaceae bacterium]|nr:response regulator [Marinilabiliaceae bacterium]
MLSTDTKRMYPDHYHLDLSDKTIAIVDDDLASVKYFEVLLKTTGANVVSFMNGTELVNYVSEYIKTIDMVLLDYLIPFMNGIECARQIRKVDRNIPLVMITAFYTRESKEEAFLAGCNEYVLKPVVPEKVLALLEKYLLQREYAEKS